MAGDLEARLLRRGAADDLARGERAAQGEHAVHVGGDAGMEALQGRQRQVGEADAGLVADLAPVPRAMRAAALEGHATATDLADYLVRKGVPFRDAHEAVSRAVREAERTGVDLAQLPLAKLKSFSPKIDRDVKNILTLDGSVAARKHLGGTAPAQVRQAVARAKKRLAKSK